MTLIDDDWGMWSIATFANPWHDEVGRFAPKGQGTKSSAQAAAFEVINGRAITVGASDLDDVLLEFADVDHPVDLTLVTVEGSDTMFSQMRSSGVPRKSMPQIPKTHIREFQDRLHEMGVKMERGEIDPRELRATQSQLDGRKVGQILRRIRNDDFDYDSEPTWVSNDGQVLDGHHRWGAVAAESADCDGCVKMSVFHVDLPMSKLLQVANDFVEEKGIARQDINEPGRAPRERVAAAVQNEEVEYVDIATDADDGITDEDLVGLPEGDGSAFAPDATPVAHGPQLVGMSRWADDDLIAFLQFGNPWHDEIGRFAPEGTGTSVEEGGGEGEAGWLSWPAPGKASKVKGHKPQKKTKKKDMSADTQFANPWHDEIGRFAPKGSGTQHAYNQRQADGAYDDAAAARDVAADALNEPYAVHYERGGEETKRTFEQSIDDYMQYGSTDMNRLLRKNGAEAVNGGAHRHALIDAVILDEAMQRGGFTFAEDTTMVRGVKNMERYPLTPGTEFTDNGFVSVTASPGEAAQAAGKSAGGTLVMVQIPKGTRGLAGSGPEREVVLPRGGKYRVVEFVAADGNGPNFVRVQAEFPEAPPVTPDLPTIADMVGEVGVQRSRKRDLEQQRGIAASGGTAVAERLTWDMSEIQPEGTEMTSYVWGGATVEFGNPWHDEQGRFAPKGTGKQADATGAPDGTTAPAEPTKPFQEANSLGRAVPLPTVEDLLNSHDPIPDTPEIENTLLEHMDENGNLTPERQALHDRLIADALQGIQPGQPKRALVMGGGAAAGKSSAIAHGFVDEPPGSVIINPDDFKVKIPETEGPAADGRQGNGAADRLGSAWASYAHEESSHLGKRLQSAATEMGANVVLDKTSANGAKAVKEIQGLKAQGYAVEVAFVTTDVGEAVQRAVDRGAKIGREVPQSIIRQAHEGANQAFLQVAAEAGVPTTLVTTRSASGDGTIPPPVLTASTDGGGTLLVHDTAAWDEYIARVPSGIPDGIKLVYPNQQQAARIGGWRVFAEGDVAAPTYNEGVTTPTGEVPDGAPDSYDDKRMSALLNAARGGGVQPTDLSDAETAFVEQLRKDIDEITARGNAYEVPIQSTS